MRLQCAWNTNILPNSNELHKHIENMDSSKIGCLGSAKGGYGERNTWDVAGMAWAREDGGGHAWT